MDKNAFLDLIELLDEERRHNESLAFSSQDASDKAAFAVAAHRDAAAISDIRRKLASNPRAGKRFPTSKRQFDVYLDTLLDSCFEPARTRPDRGVLDSGFARASRRQAAKYASFMNRPPSDQVAKSG
jgi:hypothetical protein